MGSERGRPYVEATEVMARIGQSSGQPAERQPTTPDVLRRIQVSTDRIEVAVGEVVIGDLADQKEIPLAFLFQLSGGEPVRPATEPATKLAPGAILERSAVIRTGNWGTAHFFQLPLTGLSLDLQQLIP